MIVFVVMVFITVFLLSPGPGFGEAKPAITPGPSPSPVLTSTPFQGPTPPPTTVVGEVHQTISHLMAQEVYKFDSFFGSNKLVDDLKVPWFRVRLGVEWKDGEKLKFKQRFHFYMPLPILEHRLGTFFGTDEDGKTEDPNYLDRHSGDPAAAGLKYFIKDQEHLKANVNVAAKLNFKQPVIFIKPVAKYEMTFGKWYLEPRQYVFWYSDDGFGEETDFEADYSLGKHLLLRSETDTEYSETSNGVDFSQDFSIQYLDYSIHDYPHFAISLGWESSGHTWPSSKFFRHEATLRLRHRIWRPWLRLEYGPRLSWERITADEDEGEDFPDYWKNAIPSILLYVEILFEDLSSGKSAK
ncbi:MAG: hypothetical protein RAO92_02390 [Candidatus Euphemobacter frigidus]|nr:hypothetical protein [Candidatus Euphemobacter frigidus]MDP8275232.1 hypothetical protein [Candidatus Euphemobacter frigidus]